MPRQVPFTEYEAALLLDAYLKTLSGEKERMESVRDCSLQLRQMALNAGSEIDDIYRNVNGISFQMASMESAYQGHTIMKPATRLFTEIVFLYRNDAARYRQLLKEAKGMASAKIDNEAVFMAWLAQNASGVQLSELYLAFKEIEQQAKKVKIIRTSLYESLDPSTIKKVKAGVESSKIFKFTHKHQWGRITSALNYLLQFASQKTTETKTQETARVEMVESVKELEIVPSPDINPYEIMMDKYDKEEMLSDVREAMLYQLGVDVSCEELNHFFTGKGKAALSGCAEWQQCFAVEKMLEFYYVHARDETLAKQIETMTMLASRGNEHHG